MKSLEGNATSVEGKDVVLYGFGRIGRILARLMISQSGLGRGLNLKAIVVRKSSDGDLENVRLYYVVTQSTVHLRVQFL